VSRHRRVVKPPEPHPAPGFGHVAIARGTAVVNFAGQVALDLQCTVVLAEDENA
jgi:hypothetical protein